ncbi:MAG: hypothetical protein MZU97_21805 [Bacillus subtilis]|nr:hypothetical protein [Bacillus subtilis]
MQSLYQLIYAEPLKIRKLKNEFSASIEYTKNNIAYRRNDKAFLEKHQVDTATVSRGMVNQMAGIRRSPDLGELHRTISPSDKIVCELRSRSITDRSTSPRNTAAADTIKRAAAPSSSFANTPNKYSTISIVCWRNNMDKQHILDQDRRLRHNHHPHAHASRRRLLRRRLRTQVHLARIVSRTRRSIASAKPPNTSSSSAMSTSFPTKPIKARSRSSSIPRRATASPINAIRQRRIRHQDRPPPARRRLRRLSIRRHHATRDVADHSGVLSGISATS